MTSGRLGDNKRSYRDWGVIGEAVWAIGGRGEERGGLSAVLDAEKRALYGISETGVK